MLLCLQPFIYLRCLFTRSISRNGLWAAKVDYFTTLFWHHEATSCSQLCGSLLEFSIYTLVRIPVPINQFKLYRTDRISCPCEQMNCFSLLHVFVPHHQLLYCPSFENSIPWWNGIALPLIERIAFCSDNRQTSPTSSDVNRPWEGKKAVRVIAFLLTWGLAVMLSVERPILTFAH